MGKNLPHSETITGHIGMIGKIGSGRADVLHQGINKIPNEGIKDRLNGIVARENEGFQRITDGARDGANRVNIYNISSDPYPIIYME
ncbi:hypothetical protein M9Y10_024447 [Tritrichomonas musculus]|uniref:Uncharacterized protein n=1 Tax=Tritrichomonas musculus TaxID=1915356 RepID=A0ABR2HD01_9EUKA